MEQKIFKGSELGEVPSLEDVTHVPKEHPEKEYGPDAVENWEDIIPNEDQEDDEEPQENVPEKRVLH